MNRKRIYCLGVFLVLFAGTVAQAVDFFTIEKTETRLKPFNNRMGIWKDDVEKEERITPFGHDFVPSLEVKVQTAEQIKGKDVFVRAYFFDSSKRLILKRDAPSIAGQEKGSFDVPPIFPKKKRISLFFALPKNLPTQWSCVCVFGDANETVARVHPGGLWAGYDFPEKEKIGKGKEPAKADRVVAMDPVVEHVVKTGLESQPQITLFLRPPIGMKDGKDAKGVLAMCCLANNVEDIRRMLQGMEPGQSENTLIGFAEKHKLAILAWGSRGLWNAHASHDEQTRKVNMEMDKNFDKVSRAWETGVKELHQKYGIPDNDFLLWGMSGSAQWAYRLALRKPDYFLAIHVHVPSSFDQPTPEARKVLWLLTTGELEGGVERAKRFYGECRQLGYPMVFKAFVGMGHWGGAVADQLGLAFFEFALTMKDQRHEFDEAIKKGDLARLKASDGPWLSDFQTPEYYGDIVNQEVFKMGQRDMIPESFQTPLPTKEIAEAWNK